MAHEARTNRVGSARPTRKTDAGDDMERVAAARLRELGRRIAPVEISQIWVFPPLPHVEDSAEFLLFTRILPDQMRHLCGAEFLVPGDRGAGNGSGSAAGGSVSRGRANGNGAGNGSVGTEAASDGAVRRITEYGAMPLHRVPGVVARFRERLGDHREPLHLAIEGDMESWNRILAPVPAAAGESVD